MTNHRIIRVAHLLHAIRTLDGEWSSHRVREFYRTTYTEALKRSTARKDLNFLHTAGHITQHETPGRRYYTLKAHQDTTQ